jgi:surface antigen
MLKVLMKKQKLKNKQNFRVVKKLPLLAVVLILGLVISHIPNVLADTFDDQINALNQQNAQNRQVANQLQVQAASYQDAINKLQIQINALQGAINDNEAKQADLKAQIAAAEEELAKQKKLLGENIKQMYLEGEISTLEMLASSKDLSEFVDKQQYRNAVQDKIKTTLDKITALKLQLKNQETEVEKLLVDQQTQRNQLDGDRAQQSQLLSYTEGQKAAYNQQISANNSSIAELRRQQIIANARFSGGAPGTGPACGGGYPAKWCEIAQDSVIDDWGMYNRECVSYTAFKVAQSGRHMPYWGGYGNANQWDDNARASGIAVDGNPRAGDVAQTDRGAYGHVMYVEYVYGDGTILISQYNVNLDGRYSEKRISADGLNFIHF